MKYFEEGSAINQNGQHKISAYEQSTKSPNTSCNLQLVVNKYLEHCIMLPDRRIYTVFPIETPGYLFSPQSYISVMGNDEGASYYPTFGVPLQSLQSYIDWLS